MSPNSEKAPIERAIELAVYAPIGLALYAKDVVPPLVNQFVTRGRHEVEHLTRRVGDQLGQARIMGQFAVSQKSDQVTREVTTRVKEARERGEQAARTVGIGAERAPATPAPRTEAAPAAPTSSQQGTSSGNGAEGDVSALPIPDYDELSASQVVARLSGLSTNELDAIRAYESGRRQRKTILTKIDQLRH